MEKKPLGKSKMLIIMGIIVVVILLLATVYYFMQVMSNSLAEARGSAGEEGSATGENLSEGMVGGGNISVKECLASKGYSTFLFLHSPSCPHCRNMQPTINGLVADGYNITSVDVTNSSAMAAITSCVRLQSFVPQFLCNKNGQSEIGEMTRESVIELYNSCEQDQ